MSWWQKNYYGEEIIGSTDGECYSFGVYSEPLLTIGQMIEILDKHVGENTWHWVIKADTNENNSEQNENMYSFHETDCSWKTKKYSLAAEYELCNMLWEAVKKVLSR